VSVICQVDPFCCEAGWDQLCVDEVETVCGENCGGCQPNGASCNSGAQCCSGSCPGGVCQDACQPNGAPCIAFDECCSGICDGGSCGQQCSPDGFPCDGDGDCCTNTCNANGTCGAFACPNDGTPCNSCVSQSCCGQLLACFNNPSCIDNVGCFFECVGDGTSPALCLGICLDSPEAFQFLFCVGQSCGPGICF